jgi:hypothetical protein
MTHDPVKMADDFAVAEANRDERERRIRERVERLRAAGPIDLASDPGMNAIRMIAASDAADLAYLLAEVDRLRRDLLLAQQRIDRTTATPAGAEWDEGFKAGCEMSHSVGCDATEGERDALVAEIGRLPIAITMDGASVIGAHWEGNVPVGDVPNVVRVWSARFTAGAREVSDGR